MRLSIIASIVIASLTTPGFSQFNSPSTDGFIAGDSNGVTGEYGTITYGQNGENGNSAAWYMTWDDTYLYVATVHNPGEGTTIYIDTNPLVPSASGTNADGSLTGIEYDRVQLTVRTRADFMVHFKTGHKEFRRANGSGGWTAPADDATFIRVGGTQQEIRLPWSLITNGNGRPAAFNWCGIVSYNYAPTVNGAYGQMPKANPGGAFNTPSTTQLSMNYIYTITNTNDGTSTKPFAIPTLPVTLSGFELD